LKLGDGIGPGAVEAEAPPARTAVIFSLKYKLIDEISKVTEYDRLFLQGTECLGGGVNPLEP
jgi:hypothetical protein